MSRRGVTTSSMMLGFRWAGAAALVATMALGGCLPTEAPAFGTITMEARAPDGTPVSGARTEAVGGWHWKSARAIEHTDARGNARLVLPGDNYTVTVYAPSEAWRPSQVAVTLHLDDGEDELRTAVFTPVAPNPEARR